MSILQQLQTLLESVTVTTDVVGTLHPGQPARFQLHLPSSGLSYSDLVDDPVSQTFTQDFTGTTADTITGTIQGLAGALEATSAGTITGTASGTLSGVAHLLDRLPVRLTVKWKVAHQDNADRDQAALFPGQDFLTSDPDMKALALSLLFKPDVVEMRLRPPAPKRLFVRVEVTLSVRSADNPVGPIVDDPILSPAMAMRFPFDDFKANVTLRLPPIELLPVELPAVLAVFRHANHSPYDDAGRPGFALLIFPRDTPFPATVETLNRLLQRVDELMAPLRTLAGVLDFLTDLSVLRRALAAQPMLRAVCSPVEKFNDVRLNVETFLGVDLLNQDMRADNRVSSLIFVGAPGRRVKCYRRHKWETDDGAFLMTIPPGRFIVRIDSLALDNDEMEALDFVEVTDHTEDDFNDNMSSVTFGEP